MKVTHGGFEISEIGEKITAIVSDGDGVFSILSRNVISGLTEQSANFPAGDVDALIEALQEAKRLLGSAAERKLFALRDRTGDLWYAVGEDGFSVDGPDALPEDTRTREHVILHWGPVTEVWSAEG